MAILEPNLNLIPILFPFLLKWSIKWKLNAKLEIEFCWRPTVFFTKLYISTPTVSLLVKCSSWQENLNKSQKEPKKTIPHSQFDC